jgi:hypothetical protein
LSIAARVAFDSRRKLTHVLVDLRLGLGGSRFDVLFGVSGVLLDPTSSVVTRGGSRRRKGESKER